MAQLKQSIFKIRGTNFFRTNRDEDLTKPLHSDDFVSF